MARYSRSRGRQWAVAAVLIVLLLWRIYQEQQGAVLPGGASPPIAGGPGISSSRLRAGSLPPGMYQVRRVVDGDTLLLATDRGAEVRVRLQGLDTPETVKEDTPVQAWGPEATAYTKQFVRDAGGRVRVEVDGEPQDQYDRYLVFLWDGERLLNEELVRQGFARAKLAYDYSQAKKTRLRRALREAQREERGIWSRD